MLEMEQRPQAAELETSLSTPGKQRLSLGPRASRPHPDDQRGDARGPRAVSSRPEQNGLCGLGLHSRRRSTFGLLEKYDRRLTRSFSEPLPQNPSFGRELNFSWQFKHDDCF